MAQSRLLTVDELIAIAKDRGLGFQWRKGSLVLYGDGKKAPEALKKLLAYHREELMKRYPEPPPKDALWYFDHCGRRWYSEQKTCCCVECKQDVVSEKRKAFEWLRA